MRFIKVILTFLLLTLLIAGCKPEPVNLNFQKILLGDDVLTGEQLNLLSNKKVGIITNQSGVLSNGAHIVDTLISLGIPIRAIFSPEHGFRGNVQGGKAVHSYHDSITGLPVYSLYGKTRKPTKSMLKNIDLLLFDIQDIGARYYTYISTLYYSMEAAAEQNLEFIVLDRPNPISGAKVEGPVLNPVYKSFVGIAQIPIRYGLTVGELALLFKKYIKNKLDRPVNLKIVKLKNWDRNSYFDQLGLPWIKPSPNIVNIEAEIVYPGMCLLEGTNVSEGRGTFEPFLKIGAPFINSNLLIIELKNLNINGIEFYPASFTPKTIPGMTYHPKFENQKCFGIKIVVTNRKIFNSVQFGIHLLYALKKLYPAKFKINTSRLNRLFGDNYLTEMLNSGKNSYEIIARWQSGLENFLNFRKRFLIY